MRQLAGVSRGNLNSTMSLLQQRQKAALNAYVLYIAEFECSTQRETIREDSQNLQDLLSPCQCPIQYETSREDTPKASKFIVSLPMSNLV